MSGAWPQLPSGLESGRGSREFRSGFTYQSYKPKGGLGGVWPRIRGFSCSPNTSTGRLDMFRLKITDPGQQGLGARPRYLLKANH